MGRGEFVLREWVRCVLREDEKPGGELTDVGARWKLDPGGMATEIRKAMEAYEGDVEGAARMLGVSVRTLYWYLEDPKLRGVKTAAEREEERE